MKKFIPENVCSKQIEFKIENNIVTKVKFQSGCPGNLEGIEKLVQDLPIDHIISKLKGIKCGSKPTSCPDQLATALENYREKHL